MSTKHFRPRKLRRLPRPRGYANAGTRSTKELSRQQLEWSTAYAEAVSTGHRIGWTVSRRFPKPYVKRPKRVAVHGYGPAAPSSVIVRSDSDTIEISDGVTLTVPGGFPPGTEIEVAP
jgi:hypothetical protein